MILWDIAIRYSDRPGAAWGMPTRAIKIPNGHPLPEPTGNAHWIRQETGISADEAQNLLSNKYAQYTQPKC